MRLFQFLMKKSRYLLCYLAVSLGALPAQAQQSAPSSPAPLSVSARTWILTDFQSGQTLTGQKEHNRIEPASLTKLMTAYVVFSALKQKRITPAQILPVSDHAWQTQGSRMFIEPGKPVTVDELIKGMIVQSGNDACITLAEGIAGSENAFVQMMNEQARRIGMKQTRFANSTGLPHPEHYSTAYDLALLAATMIRDFPEYYPVYSLREYTYNSITQPNRNRLLWLDPNVDGLKTGHTETAGYCLIASSRRGERRLISVVTGTSSDNTRSMESQRLLNYGFQFYETVQLYQKTREVTAIRLWKGVRNELKTGFNRDLYFSYPKGEGNKLKATMVYKQPLVAPILTGQQIGTVRFTFNGKPVAEHPLIALESVETTNFFGRFWDSLQLMLS